MSEPFVGEIKSVGFNFAPRGYSLCSGQLLSIQQNAALFSLLGTTYGGNGVSTFQLPNLGGRVAVGQGQSPGTSNYVIGQVAGTETATITINNMPAHNHLATTTVTPTFTAPTATTAINVLTAPTTRQPGPTNAFLTGATDSGGAPINGYAPAGVGTPNTLNAGAATTTLAGGSVTATGTTTVQNNGGSQPIGTLPPYLAINYIIALVGIFPSRN